MLSIPTKHHRLPFQGRGRIDSHRFDLDDAFGIQDLPFCFASFVRKQKCQENPKGGAEISFGKTLLHLLL
jgi:hypothetical protein